MPLPLVPSLLSRPVADATEQIHTPSGISWVQNPTMRDVLIRHFPELRASLRGVKNAFAPWGKVGRTGEYMGQETNAAET